MEKRSHKKLSLLPFRKTCYCSTGGFSNIIEMLRQHISVSGRGLENLCIPNQTLGVPSVLPKINEERELELTIDISGLPLKATERAIASFPNPCHVNGICVSHCTTVHVEGMELEFLMDCFEVMDWEHTCSYALCDEDCSLSRLSEHMNSSHGELNPNSSEGWLMECVPESDMMDLSYECC